MAPAAVPGPLALTWDAEDETWKFDETAGRWWEQGGAETTCYGTAIGDSTGSRAIDLDARALVGDWEVDAATGSFTLHQGVPFVFEGQVVRPANVNINGVVQTNDINLSIKLMNDNTNSSILTLSHRARPCATPHLTADAQVEPFVTRLRAAAAEAVWVPKNQSRRAAVANKTPKEAAVRPNLSSL